MLLINEDNVLGSRLWPNDNLVSILRGSVENSDLQSAHSKNAKMAPWWPQMSIMGDENDLESRS